MKLSLTAKRMVAIICILALVMIAVGAAVYRSFEIFPFALGVFLTSSLNVIKLLLLERAVQKAVYMDENKSAANYIRIQYFFRFVLTVLVLFVAAVTDFISLLGAALGIFTLPLSGYAQAIFIKKDEKAQDITNAAE